MSSKEERNRIYIYIYKGYRMGCNSSVQALLYAPSYEPECLSLYNALPPSDQEDPSSPSSDRPIIVFDDIELIRTHKLLHIDKITILLGPLSFVTGIILKYRLNGKTLCCNHRGTAEVIYAQEIVIGEYEHIEYVACQYAPQRGGGIIALQIKTSGGNIHTCGLEVPNETHQSSIFNLKPHAKAIIGLCGTADQYLTSLNAYVALRVDLTTLQEIEANKLK